MNSTASKAGIGKEGAADATQTHAINMLKADHRKVNGLFRQFESAGSAED